MILASSPQDFFVGLPLSVEALKCRSLASLHDGHFARQGFAAHLPLLV